MLLHQFILVFGSAYKRLESVLLTLPGIIRQMLSRETGNTELHEPETERAA